MKHKLLLEFPEIIETDSLVIRKYKRGDGEEYNDLFERNQNRDLLKEQVDEAETDSVTDCADQCLQESLFKSESNAQILSYYSRINF